MTDKERVEAALVYLRGMLAELEPQKEAIISEMRKLEKVDTPHAARRYTTLKHMFSEVNGRVIILHSIRAILEGK